MSANRIATDIVNDTTAPAKRTGQVWSIVDLSGLVVRRWRPLAVTSVAAMAAMAIVMIFTSNKYVSTASLLPSGKTDQM